MRHGACQSGKDVRNKAHSPGRPHQGGTGAAAEAALCAFNEAGGVKVAVFGWEWSAGSHTNGCDGLKRHLTVGAFAKRGISLHAIPPTRLAELAQHGAACDAKAAPWCWIRSVHTCVATAV